MKEVSLLFMKERVIIECKKVPSHEIIVYFTN